MNLCDDSHEEICFEGGYCPLCSIRVKLEDKIEALEDDIEQLKNALEEAEDRGVEE